MKVAFAECPEPYFGRGGEAPVRLALAAAAVRSAGHDVALEDGGVHGDFASWAAAVRETAPDLLFLHGDTKHLSLARRLAAEAATWPRAPFRIVWGNHSDALDVRTLEESPEFDAVLRHDPELTLVRVLERLPSRDLSGIEGMTWRRGSGSGSEAEGRPASTAPIARERDAPRVDLDGLPPAARDLLKAESYSDFRGSVLGQLFSSRGCAYRCTFCEEAETTLQRRSAASVVDEMLAIKRSHGVDRFTFRDPLFGPRRHLLAICAEIQARMPGISFYCLTHPNQVDVETADALKAAGCWCVDMGVESGDPEVLASYGKGSTVDSVRRAVALLKERDILVQLNLVLGGPLDTPDTIRRSVEFFLSLEPDHHCVTLLQPVPGSPMYTQLEAEGRLRAPQCWDDYYSNPFYTLREGQVDWATRPRLDRMMQMSPEVLAALEHAYATLGRRMLSARVSAAARALLTGRAFRQPHGVARLMRDARRAAQFMLR